MTCPPWLDDSVDTVFTSNFFEHLPTKSDLMSTLAECQRVTRPGGRLVVLMPNIRYLPGRYWDYLDHHLPLTHLSVAEALELSGYEVVEQVGRFLPYTVKDARFTVRPIMVRAYLQATARVASPRSADAGGGPQALSIADFR